MGESERALDAEAVLAQLAEAVNTTRRFLAPASLE